MSNPEALRDAAEIARGFAKAYPEDVFLPVSKEDRAWLKAERPGLQDAIAGEMGRHLGQFFAENAKMLDAAADRIAALEAGDPSLRAARATSTATDGGRNGG